MFSNNPFNMHRANDEVLNESKFLIPEEIPANERTAFHGAAAGAAKDGKTSFSFAGKKYPVTMNKGIANNIADQKESVGQTAGDHGYYHLQKAKELAKKDGHDYDKLPQYDRTHDKHKDHYDSRAKKESVKKEATHATDYFVGHKHAAKAGMGVKVHSKGADGDNVTISHSDPKKLQKYVDNHLGGGKIKEVTARSSGYGIRNKVSDMPGVDYSWRDKYKSVASKDAVKRANAQSDKKRAEYRKKMGMKEDAGIPHKYTVDLHSKDHGSHSSFIKKAQSAGIKGVYSGVNSDGKVKVSLNHHDNSDGGTIHKFLKKHYDKDMTHGNMQTMKTGSSSQKEDTMNEEYSKTNKASMTIKHGYDEGDGPDNKKFAKYINKNTGATVKHHKDGSTMSFHGSDHQIHKALQHHHSDDKKGLGDLNYHKKGKTHSDDHVDGQHTYKAEGTTFRERLMSIFENDKASHYKSATKPETMDDQLKGAGAKQMKADLTGGDTKAADMEKQSHVDAAKAGRAGPGTKARTNDNKKGDKKAMTSATPVNDPTAKIVRMEAKELPHQEAIDDHKSHAREHKDNRFDNPKTSGKHHMAAYHAHMDAADHLESGRTKQAKASAEKALEHAKKAKAAGGEDHVGETANILKKHHSAKTEAYGITGNKISSSLLDAIAMVGENYTHEIDVMDDHVKKIVSSAKKAGIKAKIHTMNGPGGGNPVVHIGHKDDDHVHKFLKKHYDPDFKKSDLKHHKIG